MATRKRTIVAAHRGAERVVQYKMILKGGSVSNTR